MNSSLCFLNLPEFVLLLILSFLDTDALGQVGISCRKLYQLSLDSPLWKRLTYYGTSATGFKALLRSRASNKTSHISIRPYVKAITSNCQILTISNAKLVTELCQNLTSLSIIGSFKTSFTLQNLKLNFEVFEILSKLPCVRRVDFSNTAITDPMLHLFLKKTSIREIIIIGCRCLSKDCLYIYGYPNPENAEVANEGLAEMALTAHILMINVQGTQISETDIPDHLKKKVIGLNDWILRISHKSHPRRKAFFRKQAKKPY